LVWTAHAIVADLEQIGAECRGAGDRDAYLRTARELIRALELLGRATGELQSGNVAMQVVALIGAPVDRAKLALEVYEQAEGMDRKALVAEAEKLLKAEGATVLWPPGLQASTS
jgi:hypothetical protein